MIRQRVHLGIPRRYDGPLTRKLLKDRHMGIIYREVLKRKDTLEELGLDFNDVAQEASLHVLKRIGQKKYDPKKGAHTTWIATVVRNYCANVIRNEQTYLDGIDQLLRVSEEPVSVSQVDIVHRRALLEEVVAILQKLSDKQRRAILLHAAGHTLKQIAQLEGGNREAWKKNLQGAVEKIHKIRRNVNVLPTPKRTGRRPPLRR